jgi:hypothetical protein
MGISDVVSPVTRKGSKVGSISGTSLSPGARSAPGRGDQTEQPAAEIQRRDRTAAHQEQPSAQQQPQPQRTDRAAVHQEEPSAQPQPQRPDRRVASHQEPPSATKTVTGPED